MNENTNSGTRRQLVRTLLGAAAGATAVAVLADADPAAAATGAMQYGASNNAANASTGLTADVLGGRTLSVVNNSGYAIAGDGSTIFGGHATSVGMDISSDGLGVRVAANSDAGRFTSTTGVGMVASGGAADLALTGNGDTPLTRLDAHSAGQILHDRYDDVWVCVASGTPGTWRKLAGPQTAGGLHSIEPTRVYDSRWPSGGGRLQSGEARGIDVSAGRALGTGAIETANLVPSKATTLAYTITVADTQGGGFVAVTSISAGGYKASSINWSATGQVLANSTIGKITSPELRLWCDGGGSTHVIIDVLGYYL